MWRWIRNKWPWVSKKKYDDKCRAYSIYVGYCEERNIELDRLKKYLSLEVFPKWDGTFIVRDPIIRVFCENKKHDIVQAEIPEETILHLLEKDESSRKVWFIENRIWTPDVCCEADLADRLWRDAAKNHRIDLGDATILLYKYVNNVPDGHFKRYEDLCHDVHLWFLYYSTPIHRIVAALIALRRSGGEI